MHAFCAIIVPVVVLVATAAPALGEVEVIVSQRDAARALMEKPITVGFKDARLEDIVGFIETYSGLTLRAMWLDDRSGDGLDPDTRISIDLRDATVRDLVDDVLEKSSDGFDEPTWQITRRGELQIGPRTRLNKYRETEVYDINDLLMRLPDFTDVPEIDIDAVLQQGAGGGGGNIFEPTGSDEDPDLGNQKPLAEELTRLIYDLVEPEQWQINGGDGGIIRVHEGYLVIRAPGYIHRQLRG